MKRLWSCLFCGILISNGSFAALAAEPAVVVAWNFNTPASFLASQGEGEVRLLGGVLATNFLGSAADLGKPNGALSLRNFPIQGQAPGTAGLEFVMVTAGWRPLSWQFEVRASGTAGRRLLALVAAGEGEFVEAGRYDIPQDGVFLPVALDLGAFEALEGADSVRIRLVSEFDETGQYLGVKPKSDGSNSYSAAGTWRFDRVRLMGEAEEAIADRVEIQVVGAEDRIELTWRERPGTSCTVWRAPSPQGPWESVAAGLFASDYREFMGAEPRFFQVTSP